MRTEARIEALTGVRFVAALWIALFHFRIFDNSRGWVFPLVDPLIANGRSAVDLFFVLSGFILAYVYHDRLHGPDRVTYRQFIGYRLARIYPLHLVTFAWMAVLLSLGFAATWLDPEKLLAPSAIATSLTLTHDWPSGAANVGTANPPAWSISAEFFCYLLLPLALRWTRRGPLEALATLALGTAFLAWCESGSPPPFGEWRAVGGFFVGMGAYCLRNRIPTPPRVAGYLLAAGIFVWAITGKNPSIMIGDLLFAGLFLALSSPVDLLGKRLATPTLIYLGEISFGLYLCQIPVKEMIKRTLQETGLIDQILPPVIIIGYLAASLAVAALLHIVVELPGRALIRRAVDGKLFRSRRAALTPLPTEGRSDAQSAAPSVV